MRAVSSILLSFAFAAAFAFVPPGRQTRPRTSAPFLPTAPLSAAGNGDNNSDRSERLSKLGFTDVEIERSSGSSVDVPDEEIKVRVDVVEDIDPVTITAIGFGLIAMNFLLFANLGDGGIAGIVARIINTFG
mmetsp:Transcript_30177/g.61543  ORF Transcript_30177/g.61543 Transcript_30177/m.61543 type:complete len:132 (-) Transcript_30177:522-917(-)